MKRFLIFAGEGYYPRAGWLDFMSDFDSREEAEKFGRSIINMKIGPDERSISWWQVVDTQKMAMVSWDGSASGGVSHDPNEK